LREENASKQNGLGFSKVAGRPLDVCYPGGHLKSSDTLDTASGAPPMSSSEPENKQRDQKIAENEAQRQVISAIRVSTWAIAIAVLIALAVVSWVLLNHK
jgi:hypothetical protein